MSDEPKKRSRAWVWWALVALVVLYPLSVGPVNWLYQHSEGEWPHRIHRAARLVYFPIDYLTDHSQTAFDIVAWYVSFWSRPRR